MSFADELSKAVHQVLREYDLTYLRLDDEIIIPNLEEKVRIELVCDSDALSFRSVNLLIDLPAIIATGEPITVETFKRQIVSQLGTIGIIPKHVFVKEIAFPLLSEDGKTVVVAVRDMSDAVTILEIPKGGAEFVVGELSKLLTSEDESESK